MIALRILRLASDREVSMRHLSELISSDPAFASEVLTISNSLVYAPRFPVTSILQALAILGTHNLKGVCLTVGVRAYLGRSLNFLPMRAIWRHNLAVALIAQQLAVAGSSQDAAYTAGILHDVGRLVFAVLEPLEYSALLNDHIGSPRSMLDRERDLFGLDHCSAGARLMQEWQLPVELGPPVLDHHAVNPRLDCLKLPDLINLSCRMADAVGFPAFHGCEAAPYAELLDRLHPRERKLLPGSIDEMVFKVGVQINAVESL